VPDGDGWGWDWFVDPKAQAAINEIQRLRRELFECKNHFERAYCNSEGWTEEHGWPVGDLAGVYDLMADRIEERLVTDDERRVLGAVENWRRNPSSSGALVRLMDEAWAWLEGEPC
jgi:hypothetical protein